MIKNGSAFPVLSVLLASGLMPANAASDVECAQYAETTVRQHAENLKLGCGFSGLRWHDNKLGHFVFCKAADTNTVNGEIEVRTEMLKQCSPDVAEDPEPESDEQQGQALDADGLPFQEDDDEQLELDENDLPVDEIPADDVQDDEDFIDEG